MAKDMTEAQRAYEAKRAAKAGVSLEKWMKQKDRAAAAAMPAPPKAPKKPGLLGRMLKRARGE
jgi:hypothetical protein